MCVCVYVFMYVCSDIVIQGLFIALLLRWDVTRAKACMYVCMYVCMHVACVCIMHFIYAHVCIMRFICTHVCIMRYIYNDVLYTHTFV